MYLLKVVSNHTYIYIFSNMSKYIFLKIALHIKKQIGKEYWLTFKKPWNKLVPGLKWKKSLQSLTRYLKQ